MTDKMTTQSKKGGRTEPVYTEVQGVDTPDMPDEDEVEIEDEIDEQLHEDELDNSED